MQIKMMTLMAGPFGNRQPDSVYDVPKDEAAQLIAGGFAVKHVAPGEIKPKKKTAEDDVAEMKKAETAELPAAENAAVPDPKPKPAAAKKRKRKSAAAKKSGSGK